MPDIPKWPVGLFGITLYHTFLNFGLVTVSAGPGSMIVNAAPIFTALFAAALLRERLTGQNKNIWQLTNS